MKIKTLLLINILGFCLPACGATPPSSATAPATPAGGNNNPGSVTTGKPFVVYDASADASGCAPFLDSPVYPLSFPAANGQDFELWMSIVSPTNDGNNYWVKGRMSAAGAETAPL